MADYLSPPPPPPPPPSLSSSPPLSPPFFFLPAFGSKCKVQVICKGRGVKKLALPLPLFALQTQKKITAVLLATSSLSREPVQRLIDLAKNMCIYCIAASIQHACTDLKIILKTCFSPLISKFIFLSFWGVVVVSSSL